MRIIDRLPIHREDAVYPLEMDQGIAIIPDDSPAATRPPLRGLRSILFNDLGLTVDGRRRQVTIRRPIWSPFVPGMRADREVE